MEDIGVTLTCRRVSLGDTVILKPLGDSNHTHRLCSPPKGRGSSNRMRLV